MPTEGAKALDESVVVLDVTRSLRVLIIDDYAPDRRYASMMLERAGGSVAVETVVGGEEALKRFEAIAVGSAPAFDLVLVDINMPRMNGFEVLEAYVERFGVERAPTMIVLSSSNEEQDQARAFATGLVTDCLLKPLDPVVARTLVGQLAA